MLKKSDNPDDVTDVTAKPVTHDALDALMREAQSAEQQNQADGQAAAEKQGQRETDTLAADLSDTLAMMAAVAEPEMWWLDAAQFEKCWGKKVQASIATSGAEIMRRHGLSMGGVMNQYGPYIALAMVLGPSALATVRTYKAAKARQLQPVQAGDGTGA